MQIVIRHGVVRRPYASLELSVPSTRGLDSPRSASMWKADDLDAERFRGGGAPLIDRSNVGAADHAPVQLRSSRMSEAVIAPDSKSPESMTLAKSADFLAFSAITFSSMVSLATSR